MNEKYTITKVGKSKFGEYMLEESGKGISSSEQVNKFLMNQVPCEIEITERIDIGNRKGVVTRVKVLNKVTEEEPKFEEPIEVVKPGEQVYSKEDYWKNKEELDKQRQKEIVAEFCIRESIRLIEVNNNSFEDKIRPSKNTVYTNAMLIKDIIKDLLSEE